MDKRVLGLTMICLMAFSMVFVMSADALYADEGDPEPEPEPEPIYYLRGCVYELPPLEDRQPLPSVTVTTWMSTDKEYQSVVTDRNGYFTVEYNENVRFISFSMLEYTVKDWYDELHKTGSTGMFELNIDGSQESGVHYLYGDSGVTALMSRSISNVYGNVYTILDGTAMPIDNATVRLTSSNETLISHTDSTGNFSIACSSGITYNLIVDAGGFEQWTLYNVEPSANSISVELTQKSHQVIFGMDLAHIMALFGLLVAILIALIAAYLVRKPEKENGVYVVNDLNSSPKRDRKE